jgi:hypothetical protein
VPYYAYGLSERTRISHSAGAPSLAPSLKTLNNRKTCVDPSMSYHTGGQKSMPNLDADRTRRREVFTAWLQVGGLGLAVVSCSPLGLLYSLPVYCESENKDEDKLAHRPRRRQFRFYHWHPHCCRGASYTVTGITG